jgi:formylglycine-generating enzyme required for sulfatase activity/tRNA A-37 threonylcarbamoyl transferase component Bud32
MRCDTDGAILIASRELEPGTVIRNKYRIVRALGRGGMGTVYLADHILLGRQRALKFISSDLSHNPRLLKRFRTEAQAAIELRHPNVAEVVDLDQAEDGSPYIAMEFVEGRDLAHAIADGPMAVERALQIARGVALGLGVAHAKGIIHRDVKPANILMATGPDGTETPKLLDFGIAAMKESSTGESRTQGLMLTPDYAAPEQWMGLASDQQDGRVDLYALGGVLYEMLTGQTCFHAHNTQGWMYQHMQEERQAPSRVRAELAQWPGLDLLVLRLLAREREKRPRDVAEFLRDLDAVRSKRSPTRAETLIETEAGPWRDAVPATEGREEVGGKAANKGRVLRTAMVAGVCLVGFGLLALGVRTFLRADAASGSARVAAGSVRGNPRDGLKYVWIPAGSFEMGCSSGDSECGDNEKPAHPVSISKGFWMGQTPVTVGAWKRYRASTGVPALLTSDNLGRTNLNEAGPDEMPVVSESWDQASSYCRWAGLTMPTEAQWEYAARAGTRGRRYGDLDVIAWYGNNSGSQPIPADDWSRSAGKNRDEYERRLKENGNFTHAVGQKQPNAWQLYDMLGNVFEWTADWYSADYYRSAPDLDPAGPQTGQTMAIRGGSWANVPGKVRVSFRTSVAADQHFTGIGFRCAGNF